MMVDLTQREMVLITVELEHAIKVINELIAGGNKQFIGDDEERLTIITKLEGAWYEEQSKTKTIN